MRFRDGPDADRLPVLRGTPAIHFCGQFLQKSLQFATFFCLRKKQVRGFSRILSQIVELAGGLGGYFGQGVLLKIAFVLTI